MREEIVLEVRRQGGLRSGFGRARRQATATVAVASIALVIVGCGSGSNKSGTNSGGSSSSGASSSSPSGKTPYVIGAVVSESGPIASTIGQMGPTVQAWAKWKNANGGIGGHPIQVIVKDDAGNPTAALANVKQMVQENHIIALLPLSGTESTFGPYTKQVELPVIGGLDQSAQYLTSGNWFSLGSGPLSNTGVSLALAAKEGKAKVGVMYCAEVAACSEVVGLVKQLGTPLGIKVVSTSSISSSAADYTAPCLKAKQSDAQFLEVSAAAQQQLNVARSCVRQGLNAPLVTGDINFNNSWLKVPAAEGALSSTPTFPFTDDSVPATKAFQDAMKKYAPQLVGTEAFGTANSSAWTSAELAAAAISAAKMGDKPTTAGVLNGLYSLKDETLGGLSAPINYVKGSNPNVKNKCAFVMTIKNGQFATPDGLKTTCIS